MELVKRIRKRLPQCGGNNLWKLVNRVLRSFQLRPIGRDRLAWILRKYGLKVRWPRRRTPKTTYSDHSYAVQANLLRDFEITGPGQVLVADITYIAVRSEHAYLFLITDAYSRMVVGYHLSKNLKHDGAVIALKAAMKHVPDPKGVIHHSDRGVQYCCHDFLDEIKTWNLRASMTDADHCAQNALAECMNGILKREFLLGCEYPTFSLANTAVQQAILNYNHFRLHGSLKGQTPAEVHYGHSQTIENWAKELISFQIPIPNMALQSVNSI